VSNVTQTTVVLSWSIGNTRHIDRIQVMKRQVRPPASAAVEWLSASSNSSHTVQMLTPGTTYEFSVQIDSFNYTARTDTALVTTGGVITDLNAADNTDLSSFVRAFVASQICKITRNFDKIRTYSSSWSSKVMDLGANKRMRDFLLVINSN